MIAKEHQERWKEAVGSHWWPVANHTISRFFVDRFLGRRGGAGTLCALDIGCSHGAMTEYLGRFGTCFGMDLSFEAMRMFRDRSLSGAQADAAELPFKTGRFDVVTLFDVAEHVEDDEKLFREIRRVMKAGGLVFVMVPAHMALWGSHDVRYGHRRRYRSGRLKELAHRTGFAVEKLTYLHPELFPVMYALRVNDRRAAKGFGARDDFRDLGRVWNAVCEKILIFDGYLAQHVDYPFGTTLFSVWKKR